MLIGNFQQVMNLIMTRLSWESVLVYFEGLIVFGKNHDEHNKRLEQTLQRLKEAKLKLSPKKLFSQFEAHMRIIND